MRVKWLTLAADRPDITQASPVIPTGSIKQHNTAQVTKQDDWDMLVMTHRARAAPVLISIWVRLALHEQISVSGTDTINNSKFVHTNLDLCNDSPLCRAR